MTTTHTAFATLSDDDLLTAIKRLAAAERRVNAALVRALMEADARRLYLREGCASLFTWCTQVLGLEEGRPTTGSRWPARRGGFPCCSTSSKTAR